MAIFARADAVEATIWAGQAVIRFNVLTSGTSLFDALIIRSVWTNVVRALLTVIEFCQVVSGNAVSANLGLPRFASFARRPTTFGNNAPGATHFDVFFVDAGLAVAGIGA